jgi:prepilin-type processing-associated H-X9-DG protein
VILGVVLLLVAIAGLFFPAQNVSRPGGRRWACAENLRRIAKAMRQYDAKHRTLPPAYIVRNGHKHSWRVIILPYLGQKPLFDLYRFDEPWDGPNNSKLADLRPTTYQCSSDPPSRHNTNYFVITGPNTIFQADQAQSLDKITARDGLGATMLVAEAVKTGIHWMEPRDLSIDDIGNAFNVKTGKFISSYHPTLGANVAFADGEVRYIESKNIDEQTLRRLIKFDNGPELREAWLQP